jgi:phosphoribosylformylglycinamidine cyclo-ligase
LARDGFSYKRAGVNIDAANEAVERIKGIAASTFRSEVLSELGGFGGLFALSPQRYRQPVLVSGCDGVGSKLKIAFLLNKHNTIGIDCVAMCANDVLAQGAEPLFFLDYLSVGKLDPLQVEQIVEGIAEGCRQAGCALIGGETAEMPGFYREGEYDLAGFIVGVAEKNRLINGVNIEAGDRVIGLPSSGLHSNGYSLVRKVLLEHARLDLDAVYEGMKVTLGEELLRPTKIYVSALLPLLEHDMIKGIAHITGGGLLENLPRILPQGLGAELYQKKWERPPIFELIREMGAVKEEEMFRTFNMGIGLVFVVSAKAVPRILGDREMKAYGAREIGEIVPDPEQKISIL